MCVFVECDFQAFGFPGVCECSSLQSISTSSVGRSPYTSSGRQCVSHKAEQCPGPEAGHRGRWKHTTHKTYSPNQILIRPHKLLYLLYYALWQTALNLTEQISLSSKGNYLTWMRIYQTFLVLQSIHSTKPISLPNNMVTFLTNPGHTHIVTGNIISMPSNWQTLLPNESG